MKMSKKIIKLILNEINILLRVNHPNIIKLYYYFENEQNIYLIFEFAEHGNLYKKIRID